MSQFPCCHPTTTQRMSRDRAEIRPLIFHPHLTGGGLRIAHLHMSSPMHIPKLPRAYSVLVTCRRKVASGRGPLTAIPESTACRVHTDIPHPTILTDRRPIRTIPCNPDRAYQSRIAPTCMPLPWHHPNLALLFLVDILFLKLILLLPRKI